MQRLQGGFHGGVGHGNEFHVHVFQGGGGIGKIILQRAGKLARHHIHVAVGKIARPIPHADGPVVGKPVLVAGGDEGVHPVAPHVLVEQLLIIEPVFVLDPAHGVIQLGQQVRPRFAHGKIEIGLADLAHGHAGAVAAIGVDGDVHVDCAVVQHLHAFHFGHGEGRQLRLHPMLLGPGRKQLRLHAARVHAHPLAVKGSHVFGRNGAVAAGNKGVIAFRTHGQGGKKHALRPLLGIGNVAEQVDFPRLQHFQ